MLAAIRTIDYPAGLIQPPHTHDYASLTLVLKGELIETAHGRVEHARPLSVVTKASHVPHSDRFGSNGCKTLQIKLSPGFSFRECGIEPRNVVWNSDGIAIRPLLRILYSLERDCLPDWLALLCVYEALEQLANARDSNQKSPPWVMQIKELIDSSDPFQPLPMIQLQELAQVHPVHITRQFRRQFGCSIREYFQYRRIRESISFVAEGSTTLADVAYRCAFADQAHFCRMFRAVVGLTAGDYRRVIKMTKMAKVENLQSFEMHT